MKTIKVMETYIPPIQLYVEAQKSEARRALLGYMLWTGRINDTVFGGAFRLVSELEERKSGELYQLKSYTTPENYRDMTSIAQYALAGSMRKYAPSKKQLKANYKRLQGLAIMTGVEN